MGVGTSTGTGTRYRKGETDMLDLAWRCDWPKLLCRVESHPREAYTLNINGRTALHLSCFGQPSVDVVRSLIKLNPRALFRMDYRSHHTPLHLLCRFGADDDVICEVIDQMLLLFKKDYKEDKLIRDVLRRSLVSGEIVNVWDDDHSDDESKDFFRGNNRIEHTRTPLVLACARGASVGTLRKISNVFNERIICHELATKQQQIDVLEQSIDYLWQYFDKNVVPSVPIALATEYWLSEEVNSLKSESDNITKADWDNVMLFRANWEKMDMLLSQLSRLKNIGPLSEVHTVASMHRSLPALLLWVVNMFSNQVESPNIHGNLPIHLFSKNNCLTPHWDVGIDILLSTFPNSVNIPNADGETPLITLLKRRRKWNQGVSRLVRENPDSLLARDPETRLYPFAIAAAEKYGNYSVNFVYILIKKCPAAVKYCTENL